jgi:tetratricopeptide (TPR) repeat protein
MRALDRRAVAVVAVGLLLSIGGLWWFCARNSQIPFLPSSAGAQWIVCPMSPDAVEHDAAKLFATFRRSVKIGSVPGSATLRVAAFTQGVVIINGQVVDAIRLEERDWKKIRIAEVSKYLRAGENEILVTVTNSLGPPAVWLELDAGGQSFGSDREWEVSMLNGSWQKAGLASEPPAILAGNPLFGRERVADSLRRSWVSVAVILLVAAGVVAGMAWLNNKREQTAETQRNAEGHRAETRIAQIATNLEIGRTARKWGQEDGKGILVLIVIAAVWVVLFVNNLPQLPGLFGFDRDGHLYYIDYIQQKKALPLADEGWQTYQPPLYYLVGAAVSAPFKLSEAAQKRDWHDLGKLPEWHSPSALVALRALSGVFGLAQIFLVFISLRRIFPWETGPQIVGLLVAGFLPANVYLSHHVTNEGLSALFVTGALYLCVRVLTTGKRARLADERFLPPRPSRLPRGEGVARPDFSAGWEYVAVGIFLGLAMLTKFSALLAIPVVIVALAWRSLRAQTRPEQEQTEKTEVQKALLSPLPPVENAITCLKGVTLLLVSMLLVCGWHYVRVWHHFGKPLVGNWDPTLPIVWWQEPGYHTAAWYWRFGQSLTAPLYSAICGFGDGLYSSLWGDGLCSGATGTQFRPPWNYDLMNACYIFSLLPTALTLIGSIVALVRFLRGPSAIRILMLGLAAAFAGGVLLMTLKISSYAQVKAFYALPVLLVLCAFAGKGWAFVAKQSRWLARIIATGLLAWSMLVGCTFWIRSWSPQTQTAKGMQAINADRFAEAEERFSRALRSDKDYWPARVGLVNVLTERGRLEEAQKEAETLVAQRPDNPEGSFQLGLVMQASGQEEKAIAQFERVKTLAPAHLGAYQHLALSLSNLKRYQEAVTVYKEGLGVYPLSIELLNNLAWLRATCADAATRNGTEAVFLAETACQLTSYERPVLIGTLAAAYAQAGRFEDAVNGAERARRLAAAMGQENVAKKNAELEELYRAGRAYVEEK